MCLPLRHLPTHDAHDPSFPDTLDSSPYPETIELSAGAFAMRAPAKINLRLRVFGRRADGYHEVETVYQEIDWTDRLEFYPARHWSLEVRGANLPTDGGNLVTRAARLLSEVSGHRCAARVVLDKDIPIGGGLGGGSADATITLFGLSRLWGLDWPASRLQSLAVALGSDCAFFVYGGLAVGRGRGEVLDLLRGKIEREVLVVVPGFGVSTAWAFSAAGFPLTDFTKSDKFTFCSKLFDSNELPHQIFINDLENIVLQKHKELAFLKEALLGCGAEVAQLSGSGSAIFGLFKERSRALLAAQQFGNRYRVRVCRPIARERH